MSDSCNGPTPNKRGAGECFGPETTNKFLQKHNLTTLVRSHECKHEGYEIVHNGNVSLMRNRSTGVLVTASTTFSSRDIH